MSTDIVLSTPAFSQSVVIDNQWITDRDTLVAKAKAITAVESQDNYDEAEFLLKKLTKTSNDAEKLRKDASKPFSDFASKIKEMADTARTPMEAEKDRIKKLMASYFNKMEAAKLAELEAKTAEVSKAVESDPFAMLEAEPVRLENRSVERTISTVRKVWKFEIIDANQVPREFCVPCESKIREYVTANKDAAAIQGVRTFEETVVQSR